MTPIGETLRRERLRRNLDLEQVSRELKISTQNLQAIENEQFERLPGSIFARNFVKQYARLLELDAVGISAEMESRLAPDPVPTLEKLAGAPHRPVKVPGLYRRGPAWKPVAWSVALLAFVVALSSGGYVLWQQYQAKQTAERRQALEPPAVPPAPKGAVPESPASSSERATSAQAAGEQPRQPDTNAAVPSPPAPSGSLPAPMQQASFGSGSDPNAEVRVRLTAQDPVWVRASNNGKYMFSGTIQANQTREIDGNGQIELLLGNAGGVTVELNGNPIGPVGSKGEVRTLQLRSGGFNIVPPKPAVPADRF